MSKSFIKQILIDLGGRATVEQILEAAIKKDPLSPRQNVGDALRALRKWNEVAFDIETKEWFIP